MDQKRTDPVNENRVFEARVPGHFGELVQGRLGPEGPVALVTLGCPALVSRARFRPGGPLEITGAETGKVRRAVEALIARHAPGTGGRLDLDRPTPPGAGAGSSTADILGALRAVAAAIGTVLTPDEEAQLCLAAEGAVDPLMHGSDVIFASRRAEVVEVLAPLPRLVVVGGFAGPGRATDPADADFPDMTAAFEMLRAAAGAGDAAGIAAAARISARANQARNPNPAWETVLALGAAHGALGPVVSHTGSAIGLILPEGTGTAALAAGLAALGLDGVIAFATRRAPPPDGLFHVMA